jgi:hypothetical protein
VRWLPDHWLAWKRLPGGGRTGKCVLRLIAMCVTLLRLPDHLAHCDYLDCLQVERGDIIVGGLRRHCLRCVVATSYTTDAGWCVFILGPRPWYHWHFEVRRRQKGIGMCLATSTMPGAEQKWTVNWDEQALGIWICAGGLLRVAAWVRAAQERVDGPAWRAVGDNCLRW